MAAEKVTVVVSEAQRERLLSRVKTSNPLFQHNDSVLPPARDAKTRISCIPAAIASTTDLPPGVPRSRGCSCPESIPSRIPPPIQRGGFFDADSTRLFRSASRILTAVYSRYTKQPESKLGFC
jgi:hypothetical protein